MLLRYERIDTTLAKAKELRPFVERLITVAKRGLANGAETTRALHARRLVARDLPDRQVAGKLFETIAPRFATRAGGYTRVLHLGRRQSDSAEIAQVELVGSEYDPKSEQTTTAEQQVDDVARGVGGRLRAATKRLRAGANAGEEKEDVSSDK
tara:strand:- start:2758 stop:3216 length:459 start_codon:yes stop_codon:yes gene_type:complete